MTRSNSPKRAAADWVALFKRWRRGNRLRANRLLVRLFGATAPRRRPLRPDTRRILVIRLNNRLGNILFLTPMLRSLAGALPNARIDVLVQNAAAERLLRGLPGVERVWIQEKRAVAVLRLLWRIRRVRYDLAIDPSLNSASNRLALALCKTRQRMGFATHHQWLALSHAAAQPRSRHQAEQSVELLGSAVDGLDFEAIDTLRVYPGETARGAARGHWRTAFGGNTPPPPVVGFFIQATGRKQFDAAWWRNWVRAMRARLPEAALLQIQPPGDPYPLDPSIARIAIPELEELAAVLSRLDVFVAADGGPMHLGAAAGVPVVGLFRATSPTHYAPLGAGCISLSGTELDGAAVADATARVLAARRGAA